MKQLTQKCNPQAKTSKTFTELNILPLFSPVVALNIVTLIVDDLKYSFDL